MAKIPQDTYEEVREFALLITNAVMADDDVLRETHYSAFHAYYERQACAGRCHPFLLETLADYTDDERLALDYYEQALCASKQLKEPIHTILIAIGERHRIAKRFEIAETYLRGGRVEAERCGDLEMVKEAENLLAKNNSTCFE